MIQKPPGAGREEESRAHAAVGEAIRVGGKALDAGDKGIRVVRVGCIYWFLGIMAFGLVTSSTPFWFKAIGLLIFAGLFYVARIWARWLIRKSAG